MSDVRARHVNERAPPNDMRQIPRTDAECPRNEKILDPTNPLADIDHKRVQGAVKPRKSSGVNNGRKVTHPCNTTARKCRIPIGKRVLLWCSYARGLWKKT